MNKPKVFISRNIPQEGIKLLDKETDLQIWPGELPPNYEVLVASTKGMDGVITLLSDRVDQRLMASAGPGLKVISQYAVGVDNIDLQEATRLGIPVGHTPEVLTETTADFAWALMMAAARRVVEGERATRKGGWKTWGPLTYLGYDVHGAVLGIVGFGRIGQAVARRASGFNMRILYHDTNQRKKAEMKTGAEFVSFENLLSNSDFISIHTPLTTATYHLFGEQQFKMMKTSSIVINTARGSIIDPDALYTALKQQTIAYAALDVTDPEPVPLESPLFSLENIIITPHIASASYHTRSRMAVMAAQNLLAGIKGEKLPNCANPEVYN